MVRGWIYALIAGVAALFFIRGLVRLSIREYFRLPRKQKIRGAVLPVETIQPPTAETKQVEDAGLLPRATEDAEMRRLSPSLRASCRRWRPRTSRRGRCRASRARRPAPGLRRRRGGGCLRLDISAAARSRLQSGSAAITPSLMWSPTRSVSGSSPAPSESRMSRSVTMQGTGVSSSLTSAAPIPLAAICAAASRSVCVGPTVRTTSDIPSLTNIRHPFLDRYQVREDRCKPTRQNHGPTRFEGGLGI